MSHDPLAWINDELAMLRQRGLCRVLATREGSLPGGRIVLDGRQYVNFGSNDYLGLASHPDLSSAVIALLGAQGWGSGASPLITGRGRFHAQLEQQLADFEGTEAALLFASGYAANVGAIAALTGPQDVILSDQKNHASIIDGCRLSGAKVHVYPHRDVESVRDLLRNSAQFRRRLIVTDSLFSMDGDLAPLVDLAELAEHFDAMLMVDEAHATGVFGSHGRGICEHLGVESGVQIRIGTLSKAFGSIGGFVVGSRTLIDWLTNRARPYFFSTAPPEAIAAAGLAALRIVIAEPERRQRLLHQATRLRERLRADGRQIGNSASQIIPVILSDPERTMQAAQSLRDCGLLVPGIRPPSVPPGESLLRISLSAAHSEEMIDELAESLRN